MKVVALGILIGVALSSTFYAVPDDHIGIVKRFGKVIDQSEPGFHAKVMFIDSVVDLDLRQRKTIEAFQVATHDQFPITIEISINWTVHPHSVIDIYREYGDLVQFESQILYPKLKSATKATLSQFPANQLIKERQTIVWEIMESMSAGMTGFPIDIDFPQLENIVLLEDART